MLRKRCPFRGWGGHLRAAKKQKGVRLVCSHVRCLMFSVYTHSHVSFFNMLATWVITRVDYIIVSREDLLRSMLGSYFLWYMCMEVHHLQDFWCKVDVALGLTLVEFRGPQNQLPIKIKRYEHQYWPHANPKSLSRNVVHSIWRSSLFFWVPSWRQFPCRCWFYLRLWSQFSHDFMTKHRFHEMMAIGPEQCSETRNASRICGLLPWKVTQADMVKCGDSGGFGFISVFLRRWLLVLFVLTLVNLAHHKLEWHVSVSMTCRTTEET